MTTKLKIYNELRKYLWKTKDCFDGIQYIFRFPSNYGASVIKHDGSYGYKDDLWEMALIWFDENDEWDLIYEGEFVDDVKGHLTDVRVNELLEWIKNYNGEDA